MLPGKEMQPLVITPATELHMTTSIDFLLSATEHQVSGSNFLSQRTTF